MEVMRKFIIDLKPDGTMKWAEVCDEQSAEQSAEYRDYKRIADHCEVMMYINKGRNLDMYMAYEDIFKLCKKFGKF